MDQVCELYDAVFSAPPFFWREDESQLHRERLGQLLGEPSFGIAVAQAGDELVGFAYGFTVAADTQRWARLNPPAPAEVTAEWPGRTFLLFDYAVRDRHRGRGVGRRLHDGLLGSRREERATLTVQPTATATKAIYEHWGWWGLARRNRHWPRRREVSARLRTNDPSMAPMARSAAAAPRSASPSERWQALSVLASCPALKK
jgi:ribosomal protein S18 acetylase RimI-like enzyme